MDQEEIRTDRKPQTSPALDERDGNPSGHPQEKALLRQKEAYVISSNLLNRDFHAARPNEKWVTDITYLIFNGQKLYLSAIKDLYNNEIIAYQISRRNDLKLVMECFDRYTFRTGAEVKHAVQRYIHFYNYQRFQQN